MSSSLPLQKCLFLLLFCHIFALYAVYLFLLFNSSTCSLFMRYTQSRDYPALLLKPFIFYKLPLVWVLACEVPFTTGTLIDP